MLNTLMPYGQKQNKPTSLADYLLKDFYALPTAQILGPGRIDAAEDGTVTVMFDIPGCRKEDTRVSFKNSILTLSADRDFRGYRRQYQAQWSLPDVAMNDISVSVIDGVAVISVVQPQQQEHTIEVT